ncbi:MAG TPA: efflux RND transporter permease subunit [Casimicrobiaceae bacterium]|nr:efflux RND transporter permease subunit [Casimicrobiaceae bacterium]
MNLSRPFVRRPIGTVLLTAGVALAGIGGFFLLPVASLPQIDLPVISVNANIPGASPETMAQSVATPLERHLGTIPSVNEITSTSSVGATRITLQFDLDRDIDGAARDVQAAINASRVDLPSTLRQNPTYRKVNPSAAPVMILALTSKTKTPGQIYDEVSNILNQQLLQVDGVGDVQIGGGSLPAVRIELQPFALNHYGISTEDVRAAIQASNANRPKGFVQGSGRRLGIYTQTPGLHASDYAPMVIAWRNGAAVKLSDVADVVDGVEDSHTLGLYNGDRAVIVLIRMQPAANVIKTVDSVRALLPALQAELPADVELHVASDRTHSIRASLHEVEVTLIVAVILVVLVVSAFLRSARATLVPAVATITALLGTFGVMYLLGYSLDNLSLMALTVATGFVVDDAIVVLENTSRHIEAGMTRMQAALLGAREVGFTVVSISLSLVAVFIPLLFMPGLPGRLFREFAVTLSVAVMISLVISLTTTPMMCAWLLRPGGPSEARARQGWLARTLEGGYRWMLARYERSLDWALSSKGTVMLILLAVIVLNGYLYVMVPKALFPQQDTGQLLGGLSADQSISTNAMGEKLRQVVDIVRHDPAVQSVVGFIGGSRAGGGFMFVELKPVSERSEHGLAVIARLRPQLERVTGLSAFLQPVQDVRAGGRSSNATYQYTLKGDDSQTLGDMTRKLVDALKTHDKLTDVNSDIQENGVQTNVVVDRDAAARLGVSAKAVDAALYDAFGQRQAATIYTALNQYHVVLEWAPTYTQSPNALADIYVPGTTLVNQGGQIVQVESAGTPTGSSSSASSAGASGTRSSSATSTSATSSLSATTTTPAIPVSPNPALRNASTGNVLSNTPASLVPLSAIARFVEGPTATSVNHQDTELADTISFNLAEGATLDDARAAIAQAEADIAMPTSVRGAFAGTALLAQQTSAQQGLLIVAALIVIYIVLGVLYESLVHPITVLSTLPSAGVGAVLALLLFRMDFTLIALIGVFLLIGIVKKNAILIIDFALEAERARGLSSLEAIREASLLRFRPILMTTLAAGLGALPLAIGFGEGAELRQPLGVAIIGGLIASQLLTLLTTPVVYMLLDNFRRRGADERRLSRAGTDEWQTAAGPA